MKPPQVPHWAIVPGLLFALVFSRSLTFTYVDGDDAAGIAFHALGRNPEIQPPFAEYQMGMDAILRVLPPDEPTLRIVGIAITAAAGCAMVLLLLRLAFLQLGGTTPHERFVAASLLPLAVPEFLYLGLAYTPMLAGMCAALAGHLLIRSGLIGLPADHERRSGLLQMAGGILLIAVAGFFRWDLLIYSAMVFADVVLHRKEISPSRMRTAKLLSGTMVTILALAGAVVLMQRGDGAALAQAGVRWGQIFLSVDKAPAGMLRLIIAYLSVFTPGAGVLLVVGLIMLWKCHGRLFFLCVTTGVIALAWPLWFAPKEMLAFSPALVLPVVLGITRTVSSLTQDRAPVVGAVSIGLLLLIPWCVGVRVQFRDAAWGPGFELKPFTRPYQDETIISPVIGAGSAAPTAEGPRPVYGHAAVLLGSSWKQLIEARERERLAALETARDRGLPYLRIEGHTSLEVAEAVRLGMTTSDPLVPPPRTIPYGVRTRRFRSEKGEGLLLIRANFLSGTDREAKLDRLIDVLGVKSAVLCGWPTTIRTLYTMAPDAIDYLDHNSGILNLVLFRERFTDRRAELR